MSADLVINLLDESICSQCLPSLHKSDESAQEGDFSVVLTCKAHVLITKGQNKAS